MDVAVIDCAQEENMPTCREYEIMGYPTLKFFPPKSAIGEVGHTRDSFQKEVPSIKNDMIEYIKKIARNKTYAEATENWPKFEPFQ